MSLPRVDFYLIEDEQPNALGLFACRLIENIWRKGHRIFIFCDDKDRAEWLDELLWTFKEESFIPHNLQGEGPEPPPAVQIGFGSEPRGFNDILLNLSQEIPPFYLRFKQVIELVGSNEEAKTISRTHYKNYRAANCQLLTHQYKEETTQEA